MAKSGAAAIIRAFAGPGSYIFSDKRKDGWRRYKVLDTQMTQEIAATIHDELRSAGYYVYVEKYIATASWGINGFVFRVKYSGKETPKQHEKTVAAVTIKAGAAVAERARQRAMAPKDVAGVRYRVGDTVAFILNDHVELGVVRNLVDGVVSVKVASAATIQLPSPEKMRIV